VHELPKLDGNVVTLIGSGPLGFIAYTDTGALVRGALDRTTVEKVYARKSGAAHLATDAQLRAYLAIGTRVWRWDRDLVEVADLGKPITALLRGAGGLVAGVDGGEFFMLPIDPGGPPRRLLSAGSTHVAVGDHGHLLTAFTQSAQLDLVELPAQLHWTVPAEITSSGALTVSPSGRTIVYEPHGASDYSLVRTLAGSPTDLAAWLDELTNATADESGFIVWPWQAP